MINSQFWKNKKVLVTGHTGFKGTWLSLYLHKLGAQVLGYSLTPPSQPNMFSVCGVEKRITSHLGDIRNFLTLKEVFEQFQPEIVFHLAAQSLVRKSYEDPVETYSTNVMGTVNVLEVSRKLPSVKVVINVTSDKCYENKETQRPYTEDDEMGGYDPYSSSKGCAELVSRAYLRSFFESESNRAIASVRAGNIIGGGDWADNRLVPDCVRALNQKRTITLRNPDAVRPWQHVLEPIYGYLLLAQKMWNEPKIYSGPWNFGPNEDSCVTVKSVVSQVIEHWDSGTYEIVPTPLHEAQLLKLDSTKAKNGLGWQPKWDLSKTVQELVKWYQLYYKNEDMYQVTMRQIEDYERHI